LKRAVVGLLLFVSFAWWCAVLWKSHGELFFDDAYMFYRYAEHFKQGLGFSWNLDGVHTYGMTSLLWAFVILAFSFLPLTATQCLLLASWLMSGLAVAAIAFAIWRNARSSWLRSPALVIALVAFSALSIKIFRINARTGMETMLAMALLALLIGFILQQDQRRSLAIGFVAFLLVLARPEAALPAVMLLILSYLLLPSVSLSSVAKSLAVLACGVILTLLLTKAYFHSWLPLSFYLKSRDGYQGYRFRWYPVTSALRFLQMSGAYLLLLALFTRKKEWRIILFCALPLAATMLYLCTVTQIMGMASRYYVPYLPLLAIPAFLVLDARLHERETQPHTAFKWRPLYLAHIVAAAIVILLIADSIPRSLQVRLETLAERRVLSYNDVALTTPATSSLPELGYDRALQGFAAAASGLPTGATIAATEVGYLGAQFPKINVIDLAGLNDTDLALHGFNSASILNRSPDIIWLPHNDYTWQRGMLLTDPLFLQKYQVYAGAMNYGVAILKASPYKADLELRLAKIWPQLYPSSSPSDYIVQKATWNRSTFVPLVEPVVR
jgi:hypothetical protein